MRSALLIIVGLMATSWASAQTVTIIDGAAALCSGLLVDSGGEGAAGYSDNEDNVLVICPDSDSGISLNFVTFTLSTEGSSPIDQLSIYDGPDMNAPLLGTWTGTNSPGVVSASFFNDSGCLTVHFTSNETGLGVFAAYISCAVPCQPPISVATMEGFSIPALVCPNEVINFNGSGSTSAPGTTIAEYKWEFDDGITDSLSGPNVSHSFSAPGEYIVQLRLTDNSAVECVSTNNVDLQIWVGTAPNWSATSLPDTTICQGQSVVLDATGVVATQWTALPVADFGEGIYLPDDQTTPFVSALVYNQSFAPGSTIDDISDLVEICVSMEHSYMGDLVLSVTCPNGQNVIMHQQGGNGTFIGDALDTEEVPPVPGICLEYCWSPTATNGTFIENLTNVLPSTQTPGSSYLVPGTYESVEPLTDLIGCPLNGTWTFTAADLFGIDDGFICSWRLGFNPALYPDLTTFTPDLGVEDIDSTSWSGSGVALDPQTPLIAVATPTQAGIFDYVFTVTDNFGCSYDTSLTITVDPAPQGPIFITGDEVICDGGIAYLNAPSGYTTYDWSNGSFGPNVSASEGTYTVSVSLGGCPLESEPFTVTAAPSPSPVISGPPASCGGQLAVLSTTEQYASYTWSNSSQNTTITVGSGSYSVTVSNTEGCSATSAPFNVTIGSDPQAGFGVTPPSPQGIGTTASFVDASQGNGSPLTSWAWNFGIPGEGSSSPSPSYTFTTPGNYTVSLTVTAADGCQDIISQTYIIIPEAIIIPNVFTPNGDSHNEYFVIENGEFYSNTLTIYNRWGQAVFDAKNYRNTWRASDVPDGTYYYVFVTTDSGKEYTGHVTILR